MIESQCFGSLRVEIIVVYIRECNDAIGAWSYATDDKSSTRVGA